MSTLYISEFPSLSQDSSAGGGVLLPKCPPLVQQTVAISGSATASTKFSQNTHFIRVHTDSICSVNIGGQLPSNGNVPAATTTNQRMAANTTEYFAVNPGDQLSVITNT